MPRLPKDPTAAKTPKSIASVQSLDAFVGSICTIMRRSNCAGALQYVPELTWILFLRILDTQEARDQDKADAVGKEYSPSLVYPYRWQDWAAPGGSKRKELVAGKVGAVIAFIDTELLPFLHKLDQLPSGQPDPDATVRQRVISQIMTAVERTRVDSQANLLDILDRVHEIHVDHIDDQHFFTLSQVYEGLLLKMGEKNSDGGQFFTPREVIRAMVRAIDPQPGETVYDPCCGTGGFLAQTYEVLAERQGDAPAASDIQRLKTATFYGREKDNLAFPIALANLILHGIDLPKLWHGNTLTGAPNYEDLFDGAPATFDVILTNPPFGGSEGKEAQKNFAFETSGTQVLFLQHVLQTLRPAAGKQAGGRCALVIDEGVLFRTTEDAFVNTKRKLLDECDLWCIVSLPGGVFSTAGAGVKTNLLFFTKGKRTERIWYYDLTQVKMGKKSPMTLAHFGFGPHDSVLDDEALPASLVLDWREQEGNGERPFPTFARMLASRGTPAGESDFSWTVDMAARRAKAEADKAPLLAEIEKWKEKAVAGKEKLAGLRRKDGDANAMASLREDVARFEKLARDLQAKVDALDAAIYDLKAVNPRARVDRDERSVAEILESIEAHGRVLEAALLRLRGVIGDELR